MNDPNEASFPLVPSDSRELVERMDRNLELLDRLLGEAELAEAGNAPLAGPTSLTVSGIDLVWCPPGTFLMGSPPEEAERWHDETQHPVTLTRGFWIAKYPVTQAQYRAVAGTNPSHFQGYRLPVECVTWDDAMAWCRKMNETARGLPSGYEWTLPTEAQWEYACRAGTTTPFSFGTQLNGREANCYGNSPYGTTTIGHFLDRTTEVGSYPANPWGIYDMHGNVWEWCRDWHADYPDQSVTDPIGAAEGADRVIRGGSWSVDAVLCRAAYRHWITPSNRDSRLGFRPAVSPP